MVEEYSELFLSGAGREVLDEQAEVHDGLLVLEVAHLELELPISLLLCLSDVQVCNLNSLNLLWLLLCFLVLVLILVLSHVGDRLLSRGWVVEADKSEAFGDTLSIAHYAAVVDLSKVGEEFGQIILGERLILWKSLDVHIVVGFLRGEVLLALELKHCQAACASLRTQVVLVHVLDGFLGFLDLAELDVAESKERVVGLD